ncbi:DnaJ-domain-containing protein [Gigaspora margarita]|uniref:DnaJ-domain-containing protein n=1 Tax=Gigaspora margarita TaxID=4874 RepID=A0A8H4A9T8_GIGMA|nr:DnaJ-domain-containing protein [Gigaspora margarita]
MVNFFLFLERSRKMGQSRNTLLYVTTVNLRLINKRLYYFTALQQLRLMSSTFVNYRRHYDALEISKDADQKLIKTQFYKLSKKYHPDVNFNDDQAHNKFLQINEAYSILGNEQSRRDYDRSLSQQSASHNSGNIMNKTSIHFRPRVRRRRQNYGMYGNSSEGTTFESNFESEQKYQEHRKKLKFNFNEHFQRHYEVEKKRAQASADKEKEMEMIKESFQVSRRFTRVFLFVGLVMIIGGGTINYS